MQIQESLRGNTDQSDLFTDVCVCTNLIGQYFLPEFDWILNDAHKDLQTTLSLLENLSTSLK